MFLVSLFGNSRCAIADLLVLSHPSLLIFVQNRDLGEGVRVGILWSSSVNTLNLNGCKAMLYCVNRLFWFWEMESYCSAQWSVWMLNFLPTVSRYACGIRYGSCRTGSLPVAQILQHVYVKDSSPLPLVWHVDLIVHFPFFTQYTIGSLPLSL